MLLDQVLHLKSRVRRNEVDKKQNIMSTKWVFKIKDEALDKKRYKARLVVLGFADINKLQTYAPVARLTDLRLFLAIANKLDLDIHQMDVKTAFFNGVLEKLVFMEIPEGVENRGSCDKLQNCEC
jgi:hypothetical protein